MAAAASPEELAELLIDGARYGDMEDVETALAQNAAVDSVDSQGRTGAKATATASNTLPVTRLCLRA